MLTPGQAQTSLNWHTDGPLRSATFDHIYVVSDREGTLLQAKPLVDVEKRLKALKDGQTAPALFTYAEPYNIYLMTNYCFHKSPIMKESGPRTFLRMVYTGVNSEFVDSLPPERRQKLGLG